VNEISFCPGSRNAIKCATEAASHCWLFRSATETMAHKYKDKTGWDSFGIGCSSHGIATSPHACGCSDFADAAFATIDWLAAAALLYLLGHTMANVFVLKKRGWRAIPHLNHGRALVGLVYDGVLFSTSHFRKGDTHKAPPGQQAIDTQHRINKAEAGVSGAAATVASSSLSARRRPAGRGRASPLHHACATADVDRLRALLRSRGASARPTTTADHGGSPAAGAGAAAEELSLAIAIDAGDERGYTAFAVACAGGHTACVRLLLRHGCDATLTNEHGLSGWALARTLVGGAQQLHTQQRALFMRAQGCLMTRVVCACVRVCFRSTEMGCWRCCESCARCPSRHCRPGARQQPSRPPTRRNSWLLVPPPRQQRHRVAAAAAAAATKPSTGAPERGAGRRARPQAIVTRLLPHC
jgi:hypothetical protein